MQEDGNLVIYNNNTGTALWCASGTWSNGKKLDFLNNGNLVCYKADGTICFSTNTADRNAHYLKMQDDGNLVIYDTTGTPLWATGTFG
jgi:outer membrane protein assembly factor BamB